MRALKRIDGCRGIVTMCIGGGQRHGSHLRTALTPKAASTLMGDVGVGRLGIGNMAAGLDDLPLTVYSLYQTKAQETTPMTPTPLTEARNRLSEIVDEVTTTGSEVVITKHGRPAAVVMGYEDYESLIETLNILSDTETMKALAEAEDDLAAGNLVEL